MISRKKATGAALVLCALSICAFAAAGASAAGLTAVECENVGAGNGNYETSSCTTPKVAGKSFDTKVIPPGVKKEAEGKATTNVGGGSPHGLGNTNNPTVIFHSIVAGIKLTITCGSAQAFGGLFENKEEGGEMKIHLSGSVATYSECHAALENGTKQCKVEGLEPAEPEGSIATNKTTGITGPNHTVTIKPEVGEQFTKFRILAKPSTPECFTPVNIDTELTGEVMGEANTTTHSHLTIKEPWECGLAGQPPCGGLLANGVRAAQTQTVTGSTSADKTKLVGAETF